MIPIFFVAALYLSFAAGLGRSLRTNNLELKTKRTTGYVAAIPPIIYAVYLGYPISGPRALNGFAVYALLLMCSIIAYVSVALAPTWLVGKPKARINEKH